MISSQMFQGGFEPATPKFSALCSTNWAIETKKKEKTRNISKELIFLHYSLLNYVYTAGGVYSVVIGQVQINNNKM